jgi:hypothetical protein
MTTEASTTKTPTTVGTTLQALAEQLAAKHQRGEAVEGAELGHLATLVALLGRTAVETEQAALAAEVCIPVPPVVNNVAGSVAGVGSWQVRAGNGSWQEELFAVARAERAEAQRGEARRDLEALARHIVGKTGASAILEAPKIMDRLKAAEAECERLQEALDAAGRMLHKAGKQFKAKALTAENIMRARSCEDWAQRCFNAHDACLKGTEHE